jgi:DNA (cytosine-5)-methyltransferase 1
MGLHRAGFDVVGVDIEPQPRYPFKFIQADALTFDLVGFDFIWASPMCQGYGQSQYVITCASRIYPKQIAGVRARLQQMDALWVIENVPGAPLHNPITICGTALGLRVRRHRLFESNAFLFSPGPCLHGENELGVYANKVTRIGTHGKAYTTSSGRTHYRPQTARKADGQEAMGIDWMSLPEMCEAIPPRYSEFLGSQVIKYLEQTRAA